MKRSILNPFKFVLLATLFFFSHNNLVSAVTLKVALYPYVPRIEQFKTAIKQEWQKIEPGVSITWVAESNWDGGYSDNPDPSYDIYVFDAVNIDFFKANNWLMGLQKSQVDDFDDFIDYAAKGVVEDGLIYALPQLGCGSILFYYKTDTVLANATILSDVTSALGSCQYYGETPPANVGLMLDLAGGTTNATTYIESVHERLNQYPVPLPQNPSQVDKTSLALIKSALAMSSFYNAYYSGSNAYMRAYWFNEGYGRAYIGFTESMSQLDDAQLQKIAFKPMPWSNNTSGNESPLFYSDVIGINPSTKTRGTTAYAIKLANLMASTGVMVKAIGPDGSNGPQYLLPVRHSIFTQLGATYPIYKNMYSMVTNTNPILFNLGKDSKPWLSSMKSNIKNMIMADPKCYCDIEAGPIWNNDDAQHKCPNICENHGGWSGQWTTTIPGKMSVCGCNCQ